MNTFTTFRRARRRLGVVVTSAMLSTMTLTALTVTTGSAQGTPLLICAKTSVASISNPAGGADLSVPFAGFKQSAGADCTGVEPQLGDPVPVTLTAGTTYEISVSNETGFNVNFSAAGLSSAPDLTGIASGSTGSYTITPTVPGTYVFESDLHPSHSLVGLHGVIVVEPAIADGSAHGTLASQHSAEQVIVLSEVDQAFNSAALVGPAPESVDLLGYSPDLYLINGQTHTDLSSIPPIVVDSGERLLLRYVNASSANNTMTILGQRQSLIAFDGEIQNGSGLRSETPFDVNNVFLSAGQTADVIVTVVGVEGQTFPIYNRNLLTSAVDNNGQQLVMLEVGPGVVPTPDIYFSVNIDTDLGGNPVLLAGVAVNDADVAVWDGSTVSVYFEGAAHGLVDQAPTGLDNAILDLADIDAVDVDPVSGDVWFSLRQDFPNPGGGEWLAVTDPILQENDIFRFHPTAPGSSTGAFTIWLDGSAIGLNDGIVGVFDGNYHDINGVQVDVNSGSTTFTTNGGILPIDNVAIATGSTTLFGASNEDMVRWMPDDPNSPSGAGSFQIVADMSDLGLSAENLDAVILTPTDVLFSLISDYPDSTPVFNGDDLIACEGHLPPPVGLTSDTCSGPLVSRFDARTLLSPTVNPGIDGYSFG